MTYGQTNAVLYLALIGAFVIGSYFEYPYLQVLSMMSATVLTLSILWGPVSEFIDWFDEALQEWKETL